MLPISLLLSLSAHAAEPASHMSLDAATPERATVQVDVAHKKGDKKGSSSSNDDGPKATNGANTGPTKSGRPSSNSGGSQPSKGGGASKPSHSPGNHGDAEATRPSVDRGVKSPPNMGSSDSYSGTRPGAGQLGNGGTRAPDSSYSGTRPDAGQLGSGGSSSSGSSSTRPGTDSSYSGTRPDAGQLGSGGSSSSDSSSTRPGTDSSYSGTRPDAGQLGNGGTSSSGSSGNGSSTRPGSSGGTDSYTGNRPSSDSTLAGSSSRPSGSSSDSSSSTRPGSSSGSSSSSSSSSSRPSGSSSATRPGSSSGSSSGSSAGNSTRPSSSSATRPSGSGSSSRPSSTSTGRTESTNRHQSRPSSSSNGRDNAAHSSHSSHSRPSSGYTRHHSRPYTPVHSVYYGSARPVYHVNVHHNVRWYHGVWVYGPSPSHHHHYTHYDNSGRVEKKGTTVSDRPDLPTRKVDRNDTFSVGFQAGSYVSGFENGYSFGDAGFGVDGSYRPVESVGLELAYTYYDQNFEDDSARQTATLQPSMNLYAVPWKRVSPYLNVGGTMSRRSYEESAGGADVASTAYGPHAGLGVEFALGEHAAIDLRGQYVHYLNVTEDPNVPSALQATGGLNFYF